MFTRYDYNDHIKRNDMYKKRCAHEGDTITVTVYG